jgi:hypothetical protein
MMKVYIICVRHIDKCLGVNHNDVTDDFDPLAVNVGGNNQQAQTTTKRNGGQPLQKQSTSGSVMHRI